jgi:rhodanese-related sulfurtransferase
VVAFVAAEWGEVKSGGRALAEQSLFGVRKLTRSWALFLGLLGLAGVAALAGSPYRGSRLTVDGDALARTAATGADHVSPATLADRLIASTNDYRLIDLRPPEAYAKERIPGAENVPMTALPGAPWTPTEPVLLYSEDGERAAQAWLYLKARGVRRVSTLEGGYAAWRDQVLFPALPVPKDDAARLQAERKRAIAAHFGGAARIATAAPAAGLTPQPTPAPPVARPPAPVTPITPAAPPASGAKKKEGC